AAAGAPKKRKSYSLVYKTQLIEECHQTSKRRVSKKYDIPERTLRKWEHTVSSAKAQAVKPTNQPSTLRLSGAGRPTTLDAAAEFEIYDWICHARDLNLIVTRANVASYARNIAAREGIDVQVFKASDVWVDGFMSRWKLSLRRASTQFKLTDEKIVEKAVNYKLYVDERIKPKLYYDLHAHCFDELAVYAGQMSNTTIDHRGRSCVGIPANGHESERYTVMLHFSLTGRKGKPIIIAKDSTLAPNAVRWVDRAEDDVILLYTNKAWANQSAVRRIVNHIIPLANRHQRRGLVVWDAPSSHRANATKQFIATRRINVLMCPSGMTWLIQGLDTVVNRPFKVYLRRCINEYFEANPERNPRGNIVKPPLAEIIRWVTEAWALISPEVIESAMKHYYLHPTAGWAATKAASHEKFGPLIQAKLDA
ncbi:unnamed protein product, partial [Heterosigma akashiwo]